MTTKSKVDPNQGAFAHHMMRVLGHDLSFNLQDVNERTLEGVLDKYAVRDANTKEIYWSATADALIKSLNHIITDDVDPKTGKPTEVRSLAVDDAAEIKAWFEELGKTEKTAKEMAAKLVQANFSPDKTKQESMFEFLLRAGQDAGGMEYQTNGEMMNMLHGLLSAFDPKLADVFMGMVRGMGIVAEPVAQVETRNALENGWQFVTQGMEQDLATLHGYDLEDKNGKPIIYNKFDGPIVDVENPNAYEQFFNGTWKQGHSFDLGHGKPPFENRSFEDMVLKAWEDQGVVKFTDNDPQVRADAIQLAKQLMLGGGIGSEFVDRLVDNGVIRFDGMSEAEIDAFKADLSAHMGKLNMSHDSSSLLAANEIVFFVQEREAKNPGEAGVRLRGVAHENERITYPGKNPLNVYAGIRDRMEDMLDPYRKATDGKDFAERFQHHANKIPGLHVGLDRGEPEQASDLINRQTHNPKDPSEALSTQPEKASHTQSKHVPVPSGNDGAVSKNQNGDIEIGGHPPKEKFNDCATGEFTTPCLPDGPQSVPEYVANGLGVPKQEEPSNYVMQSSANDAPAV
jgi:hypothetical protein